MGKMAIAFYAIGVFLLLILIANFSLLARTLAAENPERGVGFELGLAVLAGGGTAAIVYARRPGNQEKLRR